MYYDDLPAWGFIGKAEKIIKGEVTEIKYYLFTHIDFDIKYNGDRVIEISISTDPAEAVDISEDITSIVKARFTYSVTWTPTPTTFERRLERYEKFPLNPVHLEVSRSDMACMPQWRGGRTGFVGWQPAQCRRFRDRPHVAPFSVALSAPIKY